MTYPVGNVGFDLLLFGGIKEAQGFVPEGQKQRKPYAERQCERYAFSIDIRTGDVSCLDPSSASKKESGHCNSYEKRVIEKLGLGFENGIGFSYLEGILRDVLECPECGNFELRKFKYPSSESIFLEIEKYPAPSDGDDAICI